MMKYAGGYEEDIRNMPVLRVAEPEVEEKKKTKVKLQRRR
jgi:hypothetical protein